MRKVLQFRTVISALSLLVYFGKCPTLVHNQVGGFACVFYSFAMFPPAIFPSSGGGLNLRYARKAIRLARYGCTNRQFYHIVVSIAGRGQHFQPIEQVGTFDPMPNERNEKLVSFNLERIQYWIGEGAVIRTPVAELLGLSGFLPMHPRTYMTSWRNRRLNNSPEQKGETSG